MPWLQMITLNENINFFTVPKGSFALLCDTTMFLALSMMPSFALYMFSLSLGPLLPEDLDVRGIPVEQGRQLTISLSGKILNIL